MDIKKEIDILYSSLDKLLKNDGLNRAIIAADMAVRLQRINNEVNNVTECSE